MSERRDGADFFQWLEQAYRESVCAVVARRYPSFSKEDLEDIWAETEASLLRKWPSDDGLGGEEQLGGLLTTIALRRACDLLRRRTSQENLAEEKWRRSGGGSLEEGGAAWWGRLDPAERQELAIFVGEAFRLLSPDEWLVLSVYCENFPAAKRSPQLLAILMEQFPEVREKRWTPPIVKGLLTRARSIVREYLQEKGYDDVES